VDEFTQLFAHGARQPQLPTKPTTTLELDLRRISRCHRALPLAMHLMKLFPQPEHLGEFMDYLEKVKLAPGEPLFSQGDQPEALYIIEVGQIDTQALLPEQPARSFGAGEWVGAWEFYHRGAYLQSAGASKASTLHRLSASALEEMQRRSPAIAQTLAQHLLQLLADQVNQAQQDIAALRQERTETIQRLTAS
jgi:CRP-like cAMP-binding protein